MKSRRLLVVVYDYPPSKSVGAVRWGAMTKYLARMGHEVTVVSGDVLGDTDPEGPVAVVRPRSLESSQLLRRILKRPAAPSSTHSTGYVARGSALTSLMVPDAWVLSWAPFALSATLRLVREQAIDCVITTSPPESAHLVGLLLGRRRPAWVADFRDGWSFEPQRAIFRFAAQRAIDRWLERRVALAADATVGATKPIADDLERRLGARAQWISNGWDPELTDLAYGSSPPRREDAVTLVYTGRLSGPWGRTPDALFRALSAIQSEPEAARLRFVYAGSLTTDERAMIAGTGISGMVQDLGPLDRPTVSALQRSADALVLITSRNSSEATTKLFEYLGAERPILALAEGNEAERIVRATRTGIAVAPDDPAAIAAALRRVASGDLARAYAPRHVEEYAYPRLAEQMAEIIECAVARATRAR